MKKIVFFINTLGSGGAEHQLVELSNGLAERDYSITICTFNDIDDHYVLDSRINRYRIAPGKNKVIKMLAIWKYFLTVEADWVVGFGQRESRYMLEALQFRSPKSVHAIAGERNTTIGEPTEHERKLMGRLYERADYIVTNSYSQRNHIIEIRPDYMDKMVTITNYTDTSAFCLRPLPNKNVLRICVFGRYDPQKNCERFVEAVRLLKSKTQQPFIIDWYGSQYIKGMANPYYLGMKQKVDEYCLQDVLVLKDQIKKVAETMSQYDAFCLPSLWEGFSNSISEAICCGRPCLVSNVADNGVMVNDGANGYLFNPNNIESIVDSFTKFFDLSPEERMIMGLKSRKKAESLFDKEKFVGEYIRLFNSK